MPTRLLLAVLLLALPLWAGTSEGQTTDSTAKPAAPAKEAVAVSAKPKPKTPKVPKADGPQYNTELIVLDPAHGGADAGAKLGPDSLEKDATVAFAAKLRDALTAHGFTVVLTHQNASDETLPEARIELANRNRPLACVLIHASNGGHGVHLYTSALTPPGANPYSTSYAGTSDDAKAIVPWDTAQTRALGQSQRLAQDLAAALNGIRIPLVVGQSSVRPIDSMTCPAVALELAPLNANGDTQVPASDAGYQQRVADAVATALTFWRGHVISAAVAAQAAQVTAAPAAVAPVPPKPVVKPKPKPVVVPDDMPLADPASGAPAKPKAPIVRKDPDPPAAPPQTGGVR